MRSGMCACKRSPPTAATCHNPRPITHHPSLALADAGATAASPVKSRPKRLSGRMCLSPSQTASCARPRAWASTGVDAAPCPLVLEPLVDVRHVSRVLRQRHVPPSCSGYIKPPRLESWPRTTPHHLHEHVDEQKPGPAGLWPSPRPEDSGNPRRPAVALQGLLSSSSCLGRALVVC